MCMRNRGSARHGRVSFFGLDLDFIYPEIHLGIRQGIKLCVCVQGLVRVSCVYVCVHADGYVCVHECMYCMWGVGGYFYMYECVCICLFYFFVVVLFFIY